MTFFVRKGKAGFGRNFEFQPNAAVFNSIFELKVANIQYEVLRSR